MISSNTGWSAKIMVVSDIHAFATKDKAHGSVVNLNPSEGHANPLDDLHAAIRDGDTKADFLVCAGDICNQADYQGLVFAWDRLHSIAQALDATLIATCGNHDLDSRFLSGDPDPDPKGGLLALAPPFPFSDEALSNKYWARNFAIRKLPKIRIVVLNTSAFHGGEQSEINYGRVSARTISSIAAELENDPFDGANVLVCHHHPMPLTGWRRSEPDGEYMKNGQELLDALVSTTGNSWLVIHGHRHKPRVLSGASPGAAVPYVFGAGSLGARIPGVPNQCHILTIQSSREPQHASMVGSIETWSWTDVTKWTTKLPSQSGLPPDCGFGFRGQIEWLAEQLVGIVGDTFIGWAEACKSFPSLKYLTPIDLNHLDGALKREGLSVISQYGVRTQIGK